MDPVPQPFAMILTALRPHRRVKIEDLSTGVLSNDIQVRARMLAVESVLPWLVHTDPKKIRFDLLYAA